MSVEEVIGRYLGAIKSDVFVAYEKEFAQRINSQLWKGYAVELSERQLVQSIGELFKPPNDLKMKASRPYFRLSTRSVFIHGGESQVKFNYYGESAQRELGDLIFIISIVFNGLKYFEKFTINQFKKDRKSPKNISWDISNKKQLYLLSRFPTFTGVSGIIPRNEYNLQNHSGCLGSYGLLFKPGDFVFVSATAFDSFMGQDNAINMSELYDLTHGTREYISPHSAYFYPYMERIVYLMLEYYGPLAYDWFFLGNVFGNYHHSRNVFDFAHKYLTMGLGEPIFMQVGTYNLQAKSFLSELLSAALTKAKMKRQGEVLSFLREFSRYKYVGNEGESLPNEEIDFDPEGGGVGIIYTTVNLGE